MTSLVPFPNWTAVCPELAVLEQRSEAIASEVAALGDPTGWFPWVQKDLYPEDVDWTIFPIYGFDKILLDNARRLPETCAALAAIPSLKTALISRLPAHSEIHPHEGPPALSNFILRAHLGLTVHGECGVGCDGREQTLRPGKLLMFDDLLTHYGFNRSDEERLVLIVDVARPAPLPLDLEEIAWGVNAPDWPAGWEAISRRGSFEHAPVFRPPTTR